MNQFHGPSQGIIDVGIDYCTSSLSFSKIPPLIPSTVALYNGPTLHGAPNYLRMEKNPQSKLCIRFTSSMELFQPV
jgi:hypothetical protein